MVPNNKVPTNTQCKPVGYDCRKFARCKRISTVWFGTQITMSNTKWTRVTTSVECLSQPKRIFPISPSRGLDEKNLFNTRRTSSSSFLSFQSVETPHHYSCDVFISPKVFLQKKQRETYLLQKMPKVWNAQPNFNIFSILWIHKKNYIFLCGHKISKDFFMVP